MRPSLPVAAALAAFAAGATLLQFCARLPPAPSALALVMLVLTGVALVGSAAAPVRAGSVTLDSLLRAALVIVAASLLGFCYAAWRADVRLADALPAAWEETDLRVTGIVDELPQNSESGSRFAFALERVLTAGAIVPHRISLAWFAPRAAREGTPSEPPIVHAGERWTLTVRLKRPHGNVNPDGFDLEAWLLEHDLRATGYVRDDPGNVRVSAFAGRFDDYVQRARERIRERIARALPGAPYEGVLVALAIGDQRAIPETQWRVFNKTGITHLVSISGLHVTVFAALAGACALALARRSAALTLRIPARKVAALVGALVAFAYVLLAGAEVPAVRTLLMLVVAAFGLWLGRPGTAALVWLWSLVAVLAWDPWAGLAPGFWLSFGAVGLLLYAGSARLRAPAGSGWRARARESIRESARAQWVVTLGLVPGTLALFQQVSLVSALANMIAIPVVTLAIVPLALFGIVIPIDMSWLVAHAVLAALMRYLEWLAALPLAAWASHAPIGWTVAVAIAGLLWLLAPRGIPGRALGAVWTLPMALLLPPAVPAGGARIVVLDVGQGLAVLVATAHHALVYDTGPRFNDSVDAGGRIVVPFLRAAGVARLDALVVSHADTDHSGGALSILHAVPVGQLISSLPVDHPIVATATMTNHPARCAAGDHWEWDGVRFEVLHPAASAYGEAARKSNDLSCVLRVAADGGSVLLTGDIEAASEMEILARDATAAADVLVVPHHGSRTSSTPAFIGAVSPRFAVIAAGYRNRFGHPRAEILARYAHAGAARPRTDLQGAITLTLAAAKPIEAIAERERRRRYWYDVSR
ncbi:MAG TPA: DNA internalization-related competence protein ComEC/Rec2 [Casimicrobiaceae bacterium]|nr:DNA internalization-related competence protein ComEC/Rec2 [Casimicrobiaceae bacterium]